MSRIVDVEINVKNYPYLAKGDSRKVTDGVLSNGSTTVTSATAAFTSADVGKAIYGIDESGHTIRLAATTISTVNSATSITVAAAPSFTGSSISLVFGTDDSDAIRTAIAAAKALSPPALVRIPAGGYMISKYIGDLSGASTTYAPKIIGAGVAATFFFIKAGFSFSGIVGGSGSSLLFLTGNTRNMHLEGFTVDCLNFAPSGDPGNVPAVTLNGREAVMRHVKIKGRYTQNNVYCDASQAIIDSCWSEQASGNGWGFVNGAGVTMINTYGGNCGGRSCYIDGIQGEADQGQYIRAIGCLFDESTGGSVQVTNSATDVCFIGSKLFGPVGAYGLDVGASSKVRLSDCEVTPFSTSGNRNGINVAATGVVQLSQCRVKGVNAGVATNGTGTIYDNYGNVVTGTRNLALTAGALA